MVFKSNLCINSAMLLLVFFISACNKEAGEIDYSAIKPVSSELFIKEYEVDGETSFSFKYTDDKQLDELSIHRENLIRYQVNYDDAGLIPQNLQTLFRNRYLLRIELFYKQGNKNRVLDYYRFTVNDEESFKVELSYDSLDRVIYSVETANYGLVPIHREFEWVGMNVHKVRAFTIEPDAEFVPSEYVYEYDGMKNPFATAYRSIGYNVAENFPLCESNWTTLKGYDLGGTSPVFTVTNKFTYYGLKYPYERTSEGESKRIGSEEKVLSRFIY